MDHSTSQTITISTHNVNGYNRSKEFLRSLCSDYPNAIRGIQEHWLRPPFKKQHGVNQLRCLHPDFDGFGTSAMKSDMDKKLNIGRPYGGTGFLFNKKYAKCIKPLLQYSHERVTAIELNTSTYKIIITNAYMPYYNTRDLSNYTVMYRETLGHIENIVAQNKGCKFMIMADFNCNLRDTTHTYAKIVNNMMNELNLILCYDLVPNFDFNNSFTRFDQKTASYTLIDAILISSDLQNVVDNVRISNYGDNVSDHLVVELDIHVEVEESPLQKTVPLPYINWKKVNENVFSDFRQRMTENLNRISCPDYDFAHDSKICCRDDHKILIENYYGDIVSAVLDAEKCLPKVLPKVQRSFWCNELAVLKQASLDCTERWRLLGCPTSGPVFDCKKDCQLKYKKAIRIHKAKNEKQKSDDMYEDLLQKNGISFWKAWNDCNKTGESLVTRINGETNESNIANTFSAYFESVYSGSDTPEHENLKQKFDTLFPCYFNDHINDDISSYLLNWNDMISIAKKIKLGKASAGQIRPEHFIHGCPSLLRHLQYLFNEMIRHGFVPTDFLNGFISPIVKDSQGDVSDVSNYRGITLGCLPAKLFEFAIQLKTMHLLDTDYLQFGFKRRTSTSHAVYTLKSTVDYFTKKGSKVYVAFLDATKAFDRISHYGLFSKLIERQVPLCFLLCLFFWYLNMVSSVKWGSAMSHSFPVPLGIKQGGINSPDFFSCYIDPLIKIIRNLNIGCHIGNLCLAILLFADDICLMAPTRSALQKMIDTCYNYCFENGLSFNSLKSKVLIFSRQRVDLDKIKPLHLNGSKIDFVSQIKYLGMNIQSNPDLIFTAESDLRSFYRSANSVLNVLKKPDEAVLMQLLYTNCIPTILYGGAIKEYTAREMSDCNTAVNDAIRKIFTYQRWQSTRTLRESFGYLSLHEIFAKAKNKFHLALPYHPNTVLTSLHRINVNLLEENKEKP